MKMRPLLKFRLFAAHLFGGCALLFLCPACNNESGPDTAPVELRGEPIRKAPPTVAQGETTNTQSSAAQPVTDSGPIRSVTAAPNTNDTPAGIAAGSHQAVGFDVLAGYKFELPDELLTKPADPASTNNPCTDQIPNTVKAYNEKKVAVQGFMLPLKVQGGRVMEMLIMKDQSMCCYGAVPKINEWISVKMVGEGVRPVMDEPVTLYGTLHVGEMRENGYLVGIYSLDGERMVTGP